MASILVGLLALFLLSVSAIATDNHYISNGTCYYKPGSQADDSYAPVGNIIYGHTYCCALGDKINSRNACMNETIGYVYITGCTDPTYKHASCPEKGNYSDYQWVGMSLCDNDEGWAGCPNDESATPRRSNESEGCSCDLDVDQVLIPNVGGLDAIGHMPKRQGDTISYQAGMKPTSFSSYPTELATSTPSSVKTLTSATTRASISDASSTAVAGQMGSASSTMSSITSSSSANMPSLTSTSSPSGLSHGAVAGISVATCAAVMFLAVGAFLFWRNRKKRQSPLQEPSEDFESNSLSPDDKSAVPGFSEADSRTSTYTETKSELPGSPVSGPSQRESFASQQSDPQLSSPSSKEQYYRPFRYQPTDGMPNIQEMPNHERQQWAQSRAGNHGLPNSNASPGELHGDRNCIHELPADPVIRSEAQN